MMKNLSTKLILPVFFIFHFSEIKAQELRGEDIYAKINEAVVTIYAYDSNQQILTQGSGVVLNDKGWIVTNYHVFNGSDKLVVKHKDKIVAYTDIIGVDVEKDILILKVADKSFQSIFIGNSDSLKVGQKIYAIGSPKGLENTMTDGIISGLRNYDEKTKNLIQISAPISHGSSGGAVVNSKGELIGISSLSATDGQNLNFAIPVNDVLKIYNGKDVEKNQLSSADYFYKGYKAYESGNYDEGILNYTNAIAINPVYVDAYYNRGIARYGTDDKRGGCADLNTAVKQGSNPAYDYLIQHCK